MDGSATRTSKYSRYLLFRSHADSRIPGFPRSFGLASVHTIVMSGSSILVKAHAPADCIARNRHGSSCYSCRTAGFQLG